MSTAWTIETLARFFRVLDDHDLHEGFWWRANEPQYEPFKILINCNDLFFWACADCEEVTPDTLEVFEQSIRDVGVFHNRWGDHLRAERDVPREKRTPEPPYVAMSLGLLLYCCRVRKMRPQGAYYDAFPPGVVDLFDAAGPEREAPGGAFGNTKRREYRGGSCGEAPEIERAPWRCPACHPTTERRGTDRGPT